MVKTRSEINNTYRDKAYDTLSIVVLKGNKAVLSAYCDSIGVSMQAYINGLIQADLSAHGVEYRIPVPRQRKDKGQ